MSMIIPEYPGH